MVMLAHAVSPCIIPIHHRVCVNSSLKLMLRFLNTIDCLLNFVISVVHKLTFVVNTVLILISTKNDR